MKKIIALFIILFLKDVISSTYSIVSYAKRYKADWEDLDKRPLPRWYDEAKVGIFIHWGVYSVPGYLSEWFWINWEERKGTKYVKFMNDNYRPNMSYPEFASKFRAEFFDPQSWADLFAKSGAKSRSMPIISDELFPQEEYPVPATSSSSKKRISHYANKESAKKYVVLTSKHHDGFALFPSKRSFSWNSVDVGPRRDIVKELSEAVREKGLKFGLYHSLYEWFNPLYNEDLKSNFTTRTYPDIKLWPDLIQLVEDYEPSVIWSDGDWDTYDTYWNSTGFLAWLYNDSPVGADVVVNDRWGIGTYCKHGDFYNCLDRYNPATLQHHKWENALTIDKQSWGYRRDIRLSEIMTNKELITQLVSTVSCGGNILINVGPTKEGTIAPIFQERLLQIGDWLKTNGEAIYGSSPWFYQNDTFNSDVWFTCKKHSYNGLQPADIPTEEDKILAIYAIFLKWPEDGILQIGGITSYLINKEYYSVELLGVKGSLQRFFEDGITNIMLPPKSTVNDTEAWTLKFNNN